MVLVEKEGQGRDTELEDLSALGFGSALVTGGPIWSGSSVLLPQLKIHGQ